MSNLNSSNNSQGSSIEMSSGQNLSGPKGIQALASEVIDQIAAGEVLERPSHMVKELVENSLDAKASQIEVHVDNGGRDVRLKDNGQGISKEDLGQALLRHSTSKLSLISDLWSLGTFGFRGEALASLAAVSRLRLSSKVKGQEAFEITSNFGKLSEVFQGQNEVGTTVSVEGLLDNVPARKKFLRTDAYEVSEIRKVITAYALSSPQTQFKFFYKGQLEFLWPVAQKQILARYKEVLKTKDLYSHEADFGDIQVQAFFAPPHETAKSSRKLWLFVQNRWVVEPSLLAAIKDGFQNALLPGEHPIGALFIKIQPDLVDVNVHPTKSRVKFKDSSSVYRAVRKTLLEFVEESPWREDFLSATQSLNYPETKEQNLESETRPYVQVSKSSQGFKNSQSSFDLQAYRSQKTSPRFETEATEFNKSTLIDAESSEVSLTPEEKGSESLMGEAEQLPTSEPFEQNGQSPNRTKQSPRWSHLKVIGQVAKTYLVCQNQNEMVLVDQHAAHERYLFEKLWSAFKGGKTLESQNHLLPLSYSVEEDHLMEFLLKERKSLEPLGLIFEQSGPKQIEIMASPVILKDKAIVKALDVMLEEMNKNSDSYIFEDIIADVFASMACHSAIRAGQVMSVVEMEELLNLMDDFPTTSYCPHGRPVFVRYPFSKIESDFFRRV